MKHCPAAWFWGGKHVEGKNFIQLSHVFTWWYISPLFHERKGLDLCRMCWFYFAHRAGWNTRWVWGPVATLMCFEQRCAEAEKIGKPQPSQKSPTASVWGWRVIEWCWTSTTSPRHVLNIAHLNVSCGPPVMRPEQVSRREAVRVMNAAAEPRDDVTGLKTCKGIEWI